MASKNFPGPNINSIITEDPQIISQGQKEYYEWGTRPSLFGKHMNANVANISNTNVTNPGQPSAPEMTIRHVGNK